ncbi:BCS1 N terminal-domain-containing protein [Fimicolochytrium jonesii]|uniref:BCS1 N terminal-domain-containing protein n=1 Tax=Fimicolochytrium jonesii TaxID=1396493 RepID=UPI0022FE5C62|nr:BCS1 N terminal-domain-containing protein [Fimicolochytrium jonesii]KAI8825942.1 BCS1 N terminal-domain-containing protein [Fimicolochytrium jonesii]
MVLPLPTAAPVAGGTAAAGTGSAAAGAVPGASPTLFDAFTNNPYFSAGFGLIGVTAGLALLKQGAVHGVTFARRRLLVTLEIPSKDTSYAWFLQWMSHHGARRNAHQLSVETSFVRRDNGSVASTFALVPGPGRHYIRYEGAWIQVERQRERNMIDLKSGTPWETITLTTLSRDRKLFHKMLEEAKTNALAKEEGKTVVYTSYGPDWRPFGNPRKRRPLASVVLADGISDTILHDVKSFMTGGKWYFDRGIPYRRGYLLYGPPGTGKTSFIQALAGELEYNICVMNLSERGMTDDRLSHLLNHCPPRSIILLEDVDAAFANRAQTDKQGFQSMVTFSGLLNALDGVTSSEERIIFMTTNHIDRLDPALIRPGRVDVQVYLGNVDAHQAEHMFLRFYPGEVALATRFVEKAGLVRAVGEEEEESSLSPALLQGHFVMYRDNARKAVDNADRLAVGAKRTA